MFGLPVLLAAAVASAPLDQPLQQPIYAPEAAWVRPIPIPRDAKPSGAASDILLFNMQSSLQPGGGQVFVERAMRIDSPAGLQEAGNLILPWDPATQTLTIHRARILRGDQVIDLLAGGRRFTVLRRETNLEAATIDGQLTATLQPEGLQVGDIVDIAATTTRNEPALAGHAEGGLLTIHAGVAARIHASLAWPKGAPVKLWKTDDLSPSPAAPSATRPGFEEVVVDQTDAVSPEPPKGAPISDQLFGIVLADDFADWKQVSATLYPRFVKAMTLAPGSALLAEIARIRAASPDPKARALAALELVESKTRYFAVMLNAGGLTPAPADQTWARRYGDCKAKTVLLLAILQGLGVQAEPALVNTATGENLGHTLPELSIFDHVIVRAEIAGKTYWLDPTRIGDENLDVIPVPDDRWALPLRAQGADLEVLAPAPPALPLVESAETVDLTAGVTKPALVHEVITMRGDAGWALGMTLQHAAPVDRDRALKAMFASSASWVTPDKVAFAYDPQKMEARATLDGSGTAPFTSEGQAASDVHDWMIDGSSIGFDPDFTRHSDYHRNAPYAVAYPAYTRSTVDVRLPDRGKGFEVVNGAAVAQTVAGVEYSRAAAVVGDRFTVVASARAIAQSFPASEANTAADALRGLSDYTVSLRYNTPAKTSEGAGDAIVPSNKPSSGEAAFMSGDPAAAEAMFTKALAAQPSSKLYYDRGAARAAEGQAALAKADFAAALKLDPRNPFAEFALGRYALKGGDTAEADRRFTNALRDADDADDLGRMALRIAEVYDGAKRFAASAPYIMRAAAVESDLARRAELLNSFCWARATAGEDLADALKFCDASVPIAKNPSEVLDSRALVELRLGVLDKAAADYDAALAKDAHLWTSLYGRSLLERHQGRIKAADADAAAAQALNPAAKMNFAKWGVVE